ncbi:MAG TPA: hypothetical protein VGS22_06915 [Thermoanaerobaculia bacterium]|jgi:hypothetical protein|nr:hypothetical protein [Thermoanaerobaculia bacterium]
MPALCAQHPEIAALYACDGCGRELCDQCITAGHALLFCKICGERAIPLAPLEGPAPGAHSAVQLRRRAVIDSSYRLSQAFGYPFRGMGKYLFVAALVCQGGVEILLRFGINLFRFALAFGFWSLLVGLQLKIARSTAEGQDELPDWPDYFSLGERFFDILVFLILQIWRYGLVALYLFVGRSMIFTKEPNLLYWLGAAVLGWLGTVAATMALGAVGKFDPDLVLRLELHTRAFRACGADAVTIVNLVFALDLAVWLVRLCLADIPLAGSAAAGILGTYALFVSAHLAGLLFRRNAAAVEEIY